VLQSAILWGMGASDKERDYFRRIGAAKAASKNEAAASHQALSLDERLRRSGALYLRYRTAAHERTDDPSPYYERARALGLYKG